MEKAPKAAIVSKTTEVVVEKALRAVRTKEAFYKKTEQKRDQKLGAV